MPAANSVADTMEFSLRDILGYEPSGQRVFGVKLAIGVVYGLLIWMVIVGGIRRIGSVVSRLVPLMFVVYVGSALVVLGLNLGAIPGAFALIFSDAFTGTCSACCCRWVR